MNHEFNDRISAQRKILQVINQRPWPVEALFGLSIKAIDRWATVNSVEQSSTILRMVKEVSAKLFFLANKSQDQVSEQYQLVRAEIMAACDEIRGELRDFKGSVTTTVQSIER